MTIIEQLALLRAEVGAEDFRANLEPQYDDYWYRVGYDVAAGGDPETVMEAHKEKYQ